MDIHFAKSSDKNPIEKIKIFVYNHEVFRGHVPDEATISYPIPVFRQDQVLLGFFHYWAKKSPKKLLDRPITRVVVKPTDGVALVEYKIARPGIILFPDLSDPIQNDRIQLEGLQKNQLQQSLYLACEVAIKQGKNSDFKLLKSYKDILLMLEWPGLIPFYRDISPEFSFIVGL